MTTKRTRAFFDAYAPDFDSIYGTRNNPINRFVNKLFRQSMMLRYAKTIEGCSPIEGKTVIDIGCGPGHYSIALARRGARRVVGIDFAESMIRLAREKADGAGVADICHFVQADFATYPTDDRFDYAILMGFMDYAADPERTIVRAVALAKARAFFSFPADGGVLAWQRKIRYRRRCDLYMYRLEGLKGLFAGLPGVTTEIERIRRDFFVKATIRSGDLLCTEDKSSQVEDTGQ